MVTQNIIDQLNEGIIPWEKPWTGALNGAFNRITKKSYSFLNQCLLRKPGEYATFKQWQELGGKIKKGSKGAMVIFWKMYKKETGEVDENGEKEFDVVPVLRYYKVFHIDDVEGVEPLPAEERTAPDPIQAGEDILNNYWTREGIDVDICISNEAFFRPSCDYIKLPQRDQYNDISEFYSTAFHESVHSTGIPSRLDRGLGVKLAAFGSSDYSKEELVAELGAAMLMNVSGIENTHTSRNSAAYIQGWLKALKNDVNLIISASAKAQKAVDFILDGYEPTGSDDDDTTKEGEKPSEDVRFNITWSTGEISGEPKKNVIPRNAEKILVSFHDGRQMLATHKDGKWSAFTEYGKYYSLFPSHMRNGNLCSLEVLKDNEFVPLPMSAEDGRMCYDLGEEELLYVQHIDDDLYEAELVDYCGSCGIRQFSHDDLIEEYGIQLPFDPIIWKCAGQMTFNF